jgi:hypothetical protein
VEKIYLNVILKNNNYKDLNKKLSNCKKNTWELNIMLFNFNQDSDKFNSIIMIIIKRKLHFETIESIKKKLDSNPRLK